MSDASDLLSFTRGGANVKLNVKNIQARLKFLKYGITKSLNLAGIDTANFLRANWLQSRGGDGKKFAETKGTEAYLKKKAAGKVNDDGKMRGGAGVINMHLSSKMAESLHPEQRSNLKVSVEFSGDANINKARGNYATRPNMMELSDKFKQKVTDQVYKDLVKYGVG